MFFLLALKCRVRAGGAYRRETRPTVLAVAPIGARPGLRYLRWRLSARDPGYGTC